MADGGQVDVHAACMPPSLYHMYVHLPACMHASRIHAHLPPHMNARLPSRMRMHAQLHTFPHPACIHAHLPTCMHPSWCTWGRRGRSGKVLNTLD